MPKASTPGPADPVPNNPNLIPTPRAGREPLRRQRILEAALRLIDKHGLAALTMRRLAQQLDRDPMSLYRHFPNRAALLDGVIELVLSELVIPTDDASWQDRIRRTAHGVRALALTHPHAIPLLLATRPLSTPLGNRPLGALRPLEQILAIFINAGFTPAGALQASQTYFGLLYGHAVIEFQDHVLNPDETDHLLRLGLNRLPPQEFPLIRSLSSELDRYDGPAELDAALDILLPGLETQLKRQNPGD